MVLDNEYLNLDFTVSSTGNNVLGLLLCSQQQLNASLSFRGIHLYIYICRSYASLACRRKKFDKHTTKSGRMHVHYDNYLFTTAKRSLEIYHSII
jgi:hypothetical protein